MSFWIIDGVTLNSGVKSHFFVFLFNMENLCEFEATVVTGFEKIAAEEVKERFQTDCIVERGSIQFSLPVSRAKEVLSDNG